MPAIVILNVYDMADFNKYISWIGLGVYHSGVEILGCEFCFGGHANSVQSAICRVRPKIGIAGVNFKESINMGFTDLSAQEIHNLLIDLGKEFTGQSYNIFERNCNHFSDEFCRQLVGKGIPGWVNRLAWLGGKMPCFAAGDMDSVYESVTLADQWQQGR